MITTFSPSLDSEQATFLDEFGFQDVRVLKSLGGGMFSRPLMIEADGQRYLLRTHTFRATESAFRYQAEAIAWVASHGVSCARVVQATDGSWCRLLTDRPAVIALHEYMEGQTENWLEWHSRKESQPDFLPALGRLVARVHNVLRQAPGAGEQALSLDLPPVQLDSLTSIRHHWTRELDWLATSPQPSAAGDALVHLRARIDEHWRRLSAAIEPRLERLPRQIVHGDVSPVNLILCDDGSWSFIDWDCVHYGWRAYDALGDILNRPPHEHAELNRFREDHVASYLRGYDAEIDPHLTDDEYRLVPAFCLARQLEDLRQRLRALPSAGDPSDELYALLIHRRVAMMDQISLN